MHDLPGSLAGKALVNLGNSITLCPEDKPKQLLTLPKAGVQVATSVLDIMLDIRVKKNNNNSLRDINLPLDDCANPLNDMSVQPMIRAMIEWGTGSNGVFQAEVDFLLGTQLAFAAETLTITAKYLYTCPKGGINPEALNKLPTFELSAGLGYGCVGKNATLTEYVNLPNPGDTCILQIPQYTNSFTVQPTNSSIAQANMFGFAKNLSTQFLFSAGGGPDEFGIGQQVRIFNGARFLEITNKNLVGSLDAFVIFSLSL